LWRLVGRFVDQAADVPPAFDHSDSDSPGVTYNATICSVYTHTTRSSPVADRAHPSMTGA
jgi:hypothetical protein